ncbi:hypothetical protein SAMN05428988_0168 [Chitinophaga sp. YR573]|uniref:hypothetical protein n=1 Tax=Chitinophaga sp. YR573 TaxID=1881040 RepID=UPI0008D59532|nr:hypothetical protein [Chitinophaga sp. YR573]SEV89022.1 hypothetical protein SAMN05428988_0168 [Chitinophaga sp. YR573]
MKSLFSLFIFFSFFHATAQVVNSNVPRRTDGRNIVQDRALWADRILIIPRYSGSTNLNGGVDTVGYLGFNSSDTTLNVRGTGIWFPFPSKAWVLTQIGVPSLSIYNNSSFLTGNRLVGGRNNLFGLTIDSLAYLLQATRSLTSDTTSQVSIVPGQTEMGSYRTTGSRTSTLKTSVLPGNYYVNIYNGSPTGIYLDSSNNTGLGTLAPTEKLQVNGNVKLIHIIGNSTAPTAAIGSAVTAGSVAVTGTDIAGTVTLTVSTGGSFATLANFFELTFNNTYGIAPIVLFSPVDASAANLSAVYVKNTTTSSFQLASAPSGTLNTGTYTWKYHVIQ